VRIRDFQIGIEQDRGGFADPRASWVIRRLPPIEEAIRWELTAERVTGPARNISVILYNIERTGFHKEPAIALGSMLVWVGVAESDMVGEYRIFKNRTLTAVRQGIEDLQRCLSCDLKSVMEIAERVDNREPVFHVHWKRMTQSIRATGGRAEVWLTYDENGTRVEVVVDDGKNRRNLQIAAQHRASGGIDYWFPLHHTVLVGNFMVFKDRGNRTLARVAIAGRTVGATPAVDDLQKLKPGTISVIRDGSFLKFRSAGDCTRRVPIVTRVRITGTHRNES